MTPARSSPHVRPALILLERCGLLLLQDPTLPSLVGLIAEGPVRGSWWGHPKSSEMFHAAGDLTDHPDVASTKLVSGKVTFVHRRLWPQLIAIGRSREAWQLLAVSREARTLLARVDEAGSVRTSGRAAKQLEQRLLVASRQVHTASGAHALELMTWDSFARQRKLPMPKIPVAQARADIEAVLHAMNAEFAGRGKLPWEG